MKKHKDIRLKVTKTLTQFMSKKYRFTCESPGSADPRQTCRPAGALLCERGCQPGPDRRSRQTSAQPPKSTDVHVTHVLNSLICASTSSLVGVRSTEAS